MWLTRAPSSSTYIMSDVQSILHSIISSGLILGGQSLSKRQTVFFLTVDTMYKNHKDPDTIDLNAPRRAKYLHNAWKKHQDAFFFGSILILQFGEDWHSIRLHQMQLSFKEYFQLIVFQKLLGWKLEKSYSRSYPCHLGVETRMEKRIGFRTCSTTRSWATI